jgi:hypothetical protein
MTRFYSVFVPVAALATVVLAAAAPIQSWE